MAPGCSVTTPLLGPSLVAPPLLTNQLDADLLPSSNHHVTTVQSSLTTAPCSLATTPYVAPPPATPTSSSTTPTSSTVVSKTNPSKRHRERLNSELDNLAALLPFEQAVISKLDKLSILRLAVSYLRAKAYFQASLHERFRGRIPPPSGIDRHYNNKLTSDSAPFCDTDGVLQALCGFLLAVAEDGEVFFASRSVEQYLGFHQSDIVHQSALELIHSEDREEFRNQLNWRKHLQETNDKDESHDPLKRCFMVRFRCLLDNTSGFITLEVSGRFKTLVGQQLNNSDTNRRKTRKALFALCCPFGPLPLVDVPSSDYTFKSRHEMDMTPQSMDARGQLLFGYSELDLRKKRGYTLLHPHDLVYFSAAHEELIKTGSAGLIAYRWCAADEIDTTSNAQGRISKYAPDVTLGEKWVWLQTSAKVIYKNSKADHVIATHRHLTEDEGKDLFGKRGTEFKLPYPIIDHDNHAFRETNQHYSRYPSMTSRGSMCTSGPFVSSQSNLVLPIPPHLSQHALQHPPQHPLNSNTVSGGVLVGDPLAMTSNPISITTTSGTSAIPNPDDHQRRYKVRTRKSKTQLRDYLQAGSKKKTGSPLSTVVNPLANLHSDPGNGVLAPNPGYRNDIYPPNTNYPGQLHNIPITNDKDNLYNPYYPTSNTSTMTYQGNDSAYWNTNGTPSLATPSLNHAPPTIHNQAPPTFNGYPTPPSDSNRNGGITDDKSIYKTNGYYPYSSTLAYINQSNGLYTTPYDDTAPTYENSLRDPLHYNTLRNAYGLDLSAKHRLLQDYNSATVVNSKLIQDYTSASNTTNSRLLPDYTSSVELGSTIDYQARSDLHSTSSQFLELRSRHYGNPSDHQNTKTPPITSQYPLDSSMTGCQFNSCSDQISLTSDPTIAYRSAIVPEVTSHHKDIDLSSMSSSITNTQIATNDLDIYEPPSTHLSVIRSAVSTSASTLNPGETRRQSPDSTSLYTSDVINSAQVSCIVRQQSKENTKTSNVQPDFPIRRDCSHTSVIQPLISCISTDVW